MKRFAWFCAAMALGSATSLGLDTPKGDEGTKDPTEILKKVDEAAKKVQAVRYKASAHGTGKAIEFMGPAVEGTVILAGRSEQGGPAKFRCEVKGKKKGSEETSEFTAGSDGETYFLIDPKSKTVYEDMDRNVIGPSAGMMLRGIIMNEFAHPTPFGDEIEADTKEFMEDKKIGSEDCYQIRVVYKGGRGESIWCFSKKDFLPRGREQVFKGPEGPAGSWTNELTDLTLDPKTSEDMFKATVPEGYKKSEDFAP